MKSVQHAVGIATVFLLMAPGCPASDFKIDRLDPISLSNVIGRHLQGKSSLLRSFRFEGDRTLHLAGNPGAPHFLLETSNQAPIALYRVGVLDFLGFRKSNWGKDSILILTCASILGGWDPTESLLLYKPSVGFRAFEVPNADRSEGVGCRLGLVETTNEITVWNCRYLEDVGIRRAFDSNVAGVIQRGRFLPLPE